MKELIFGGSSDDTFGLITPCGDDYDNCASGEPIEWLVESSEGSLVVSGQYCPGAATGWLIGIARAVEDDEESIPNWPMRFEQSQRPYSPALHISAPDDVRVCCLQAQSNGDEE